MLSALKNALTVLLPELQGRINPRYHPASSYPHSADKKLFSARNVRHTAQTTCPLSQKAPSS